MPVTRFRWASGLVLLAILVAAALPAHAQQILVGARQQHDKVRISGFLWRGKPTGTLYFRELADVPGFEQGIDVTDGLGFSDSANGWIIEGNVAAGQRHRFLFEVSRLQSVGDQTFPFAGVGPIPPLSIGIDSELNLRTFDFMYNYLFSASPQAEFGVLGGLGWFETEAALTSTIGSATGKLDQPFPLIGTNLMLNPKGPVRGYVEVTGFPRIKVDELSGWQLDFVARIEVFAVRNFGVIAGYRRYRVVLDEESQNVGLDLVWSGFVFGAQVRY